MPQNAKHRPNYRETLNRSVPTKEKKQTKWTFAAYNGDQRNNNQKYPTRTEKSTVTVFFSTVLNF